MYKLQLINKVYAKKINYECIIIKCIRKQTNEINALKFWKRSFVFFLHTMAKLVIFYKYYLLNKNNEYATT